MNKRLMAMLAVLVLALSAGFAAGCGDDDDDGGDSTTASGGGDLGTITEGQLLVGTDTPFPPFEIGQPPDISGYDIEVMNAIGEEIGLEVDLSGHRVRHDLPRHANGQFDTAAAASTITPERQEKVNFTDPYYEAQQALLVPEGSDIATDGRPRRQDRRRPGRDHW